VIVPSTKQKLAFKLNGIGFVDGILSTLYRTRPAAGVAGMEGAQVQTVHVVIDEIGQMPLR
jgi:hypothetical protein